MKLEKKLFLLIASCLLLCGCSNPVLKIMEKQSKYEETEEYVQYLNIINTKSDEDRYAPIRLTYSNNQYIEADFYYDKEYTQSVDFSKCYLNPGDTLYYDNLTVSSARNGQYTFKGFSIIEYDNEGNTGETYNWSNLENNIAVQIPENFGGTELSLYPSGIFEGRLIFLNDYYIDSTGSSIELNNNWYINSNITQELTYTLKATESYSVHYEFDNEQYYYLGAYVNGTAIKPVNPNPDKSGKVIFEISDPSNQNNEFSVQLGKCLTSVVKVDNPKDVVYKITDRDEETVTSNSFVIDKLKNGDNITFSSSNKVSISIDGMPLTARSEGEKYYYNYVIGTDKYFILNPTDYVFEHGTVEFYHNGIKVIEEKRLDDGSTIIVRGKPDAGYWFPDNNAIITVKGLNTSNDINSLSFAPDNNVIVNVPSNVVGGTITYKINGKNVEVKHNTIETKSGMTIQAVLDAWDGWNCSGENKYEYKVTKASNQDYRFGESTYDDLFKETVENRPDLTIKMSSNFKGIDMPVSIYFEGSDKYKDDNKLENKTYSTSLFTIDTTNIDVRDAVLVNEKDCYTSKGVTIKIQAGENSLSGKAIKIISKKTSGKNTETDVQYITSIPNEYFLDVYDYNSKSIATKHTQYDKVEIYIDLVEVEECKSFTVNNGRVVITREDVSVNKVVKTKDIIENSTKVNITIYPNNGYFISGKSTNYGSSFSDTMTYEKLLTNFNDIVAKHEIKRQIPITLDNTDEYGTCTYKRENGDIITGKVLVNEDEKISLEFTLNNGYEVDKSGLDSVISFFNKSNQVEATLTITADNANNTISREDFGIKVKKQGGK